MNSKLIMFVNQLDLKQQKHRLHHLKRKIFCRSTIFSLLRNPMGIKKKKKKKSKNQHKISQDRFTPQHDTKSLLRPLNDLQSEITEDIVYFFRSFPEAMRSPQIATETLIKAVLPTEKIAMEPEFDDIFGDPITCTSIYSEVISKMEVNWKSFGDLPPQLAASIRRQIMEETIRQFLTESLRYEILDGLNRYRLRKKESGNKMEAGIAAALQLVLKDEKNNPIWPKIGLLHGIIHNSITLGLDIKNSYKEILGETKDNTYEDNELLLLDDQTREKILQKASSKINKIPRLKNFINNQTERIYDKGINAILEGKLFFGFLTTDELNKVSEHIVKSIGSSDKEQLRNAKTFLDRLTDKKQKELISGMEIFIHEIFTAEKIEQMHQKLNSILKAPGDLKHWELFIFMLRNALMHEDVMKSRKNFFFMCIILGELGAFQGDSPNSGTTGSGS
jgi:hypothetical protein